MENNRKNVFIKLINSDSSEDQLLAAELFDISLLPNYIQNMCTGRLTAFEEGRCLHVCKEAKEIIYFKTYGERF